MALITQLNTWVCLGDTIADLPDHETSPRGTLFVDQSTGVLYVNEEAAWVSVSGGGAAAFPLTANVSANGFKITDLGSPTPGSNDAANAAYVDAGDANTLSASETFTTEHGLTWLNVKADFGAVGDGVTDDAPAFRAAAAAMITQDRATLYIPSGTYRIGSTSGGYGVAFGPPGGAQYYRRLVLQGDGDSSRIYFDTPGFTSMVFGHLFGLTFKNLWFIGQLHRAVDCLNGLEFINSFYTSIENCSFYGIGASNAVIHCYSSDVRFHQCYSGGSVGQRANVLSELTNHLGFYRMSFDDIGIIDGVDWGKIGFTGFEPTWIEVTDPQPPDIGGFSIELQHMYLDEGAIRGLYIHSTNGNKHPDVRLIDVIHGANPNTGVGVPAIDIQSCERVFIDRMKVLELRVGGYLQKPAYNFVDAGYVLMRRAQTSLLANDANVIVADSSTLSLALEEMALGVDYRTLTSAAGQTTVKPTPDGSVYSNGTRPAAASVPGMRIFNTSTNLQNFSDGTNWRDAAGAVV